MILQRLQLTNYLQHKAVDQDLSGTMIAILGPNGSGKSNLLGAIQFMFIGEQPGYKKDELITWGETEGYGTLNFEHDGIQGEIYRRLDKGEARFTYGNEEFNGITAVAAAIKEKIGLDKDLAKQGVFVLQAELDAILFTDARTRELSFQKLMGIGDVAKVYDAIGKEITKLDKPQDYSAQIAEGLDKIAETEGRVKTLRESVAATTAKLGPVSTKELDVQIDRGNKLLNVIASTDAAMRGAGGGGKESEGVQVALETAGHKLKAALGDGWDTTQEGVNLFLDHCNTAKGLLVQLDPIAKDVAKQRARYTAAEAAFTQHLNSDVRSPPEAIEEMFHTIASLNDDLNKLLGARGLHDSLLKALRSAQADNLGECPVCGAPVTDKEALENRLSGKINEMSAVATDLHTDVTSQTATANKLKADAEAYERTRVACSNELKAAEVQLKEFERVFNERCMAATGDGMETYDAEATNKNIEMLTESYNAVRNASAEYYRLLSESTTLAKAEKAAADNVIDALNELAAATGQGANVVSSTDWRAERRDEIGAELLRLRIARDEASSFAVELANLNGMLTELEKANGAMKVTIDKLVKAQESNANVAKAITTLQNVREWFHYANGPHALAANVLEAITPDVNRFLSLFTAPFVVYPSEDSLGFTYTYTDGRVTPEGGADASKLSGGQKAQLAVSFRFATYSMFASKLGLLSLDEPTAYLDDQNVGRFGSLLEKVKEVAKTMNVQVMMATHERGVMPFMDTTIDLGDQ